MLFDPNPNSKAVLQHQGLIMCFIRIGATDSCHTSISYLHRLCFHKKKSQAGKKKKSRDATVTRFELVPPKRLDNSNDRMIFKSNALDHSATQPICCEE